MARITISKEARKDLVAIQEYISNELYNPDAAQRIIREIKRSILRLQDFPECGRPLDALLSVHTEYRYLVCEGYSIFYLASSQEALVVRILNQRQDYIRALFM